MFVKYELLCHLKSLLGPLCAPWTCKQDAGQRGLDGDLTFHAKPLDHSLVACEAVYNSGVFLLSPFSLLYHYASPGIRCSLGAAARAVAAKGVPTGWYQRLEQGWFRQRVGR